NLERVPGLFLELGVTNGNSPGGPRKRTHGMSRREGGPHGLKTDPSTRADDQDYRHAPDRTRLAHRHVRCRQPHRKMGGRLETRYQGRCRRTPRVSRSGKNGLAVSKTGALDDQGHRSFASARRPAPVIRMRVTSIRRPPATMRSMLAVASPASTSSIRNSVLNP